MMGKIRAVRAAFERGGAQEVLTTTRRWAAEALRPESSTPTPPPTPAPPAVTRTLSATDVGFAAATSFFERRRSTYEELADAIAPYLPEDGVLFDVGGNIGFFTKVVGERTGFRGDAHLFEPLPHLAGMIPHTLEGAPYSVVVHQYGLSDEDASLDIYIAADGNLGWNTLVKEATNPGMVPVPIKVRRFDEVAPSSTPSLVKIDVEGAEYLVLRGMLPAIEAWSPRPPILCEIGWGAEKHPAWKEEVAVFEELFALGYRATALDGSSVDIQQLTKTSDVLLLPAP